MQSIKANLIGTDEAARTFTFRASSAAVDRQNEVIDQTGWSLEAYRANPVILDSHKYGSIDDILGRASRVELMPEGLEIDVQFADTERGRTAQKMVEDGFLRSVSVGFRSMARRPGARAGEPLTHTAMELLEVSMVAIPANRDAVRLRGMEDDMGIETETKARRKSTADKLRGIMALLAQLVDELEPGDDMEMEGMKPKPMKAFSPDPATLAALAAFAREANNNG